jgi:hypothetical protein
MNKQGIMRVFESVKHAMDAGFETILTEPEREALEPLPPEQRHAALHRLRNAETRRKEAGKASRRDKSRAARKAKRLQRNR